MSHRNYRAEPEEELVKGVPGNERINTLSDGVFSIVITLLVLELKVPQITGDNIGPKLAASLWHEMPAYLGHAISFVVLGIYWVGHHNMFMHIKRHDRVLMWLNILFLMLVASMPFPTGLLVQYGDQQIAVVIYAGILVAAGLALDLVWWYASGGRRLVEKDIDPDLVSFVHRRVLIAPVCYLLAIGISFLDVTAARLLFAVVAVFYIVPNPLDRYHHRQVRIQHERGLGGQIKDAP